MERYVDLFKRRVINFKLELCCFMLPVKSGLLAFAFLHVAIGVSTLVFFAEESFEPLLLKVLNGIAEEHPQYEPSCMIVYAVELGSNIVLLCGVIRNDLVLLRVYMYFALGVLVAALMTYSVMFIPQELIVKFLIAASIGHQIYILLLLRSSMVEIKQSSKQDDYYVKYRKSSVKYVPGTRDRYSVVIEPYRRRSSGPYGTEYRRSSSLVPLKETYGRSTPYFEEADKRRSSVATVVQEGARSIEVVNEESDKRRNSVVSAVQEAPIEAAKEEITTVHSPMDDVVKEEVDKEGSKAKGKEVKHKRNIFGRKRAKKERDVANDV